MPTFKPVKSTPFIIPDGEYKIEIESATDNIAKTSNDEYIAMRCRVKMPDGSNGPIIRDNLNFNSIGARTRSSAALEALGVAVNFEDENFEITAAGILGKEAQVYVKHKPEDDCMNIKSWIIRKSAAPKPKLVAVKEEDSDDIPF